jgi:hypothetical protein
MRSRPCNCGSGEHSEWKYDARGIELCRACSICWPAKKSMYRAEVLTDANYETSEPIEED